MEILIAIASMLILSGLARVWNSFSKFRICQICAGVAGTWLWMLVGMHSGLLPTANYLLLTAVLMGGSAVGIAYAMAKSVPDNLDLAWKTTFIPLGFAAAYELLSWRLGYFTMFFAFSLIAAWFFTRKPQKGEKKSVEQIKKGLEKCC